TRFDWIVPTCEEVFWLAAAAERDGWGRKLFAPAPDSLRRLHSKALFPALARSAGIAAPETIVLESRAAVAALAGHGRALVLKPEYSRFGRRALVGPSAESLERLAPEPEKRWVAQERIEGEELCVWSAM